MFGHLKKKVFSRNLNRTVEELQSAIVEDVNNVTPNVLINVFNNLKKRVNLCIENKSTHFKSYF